MKSFILLCFMAINFCGLQASFSTEAFCFNRGNYIISMQPTSNQHEMEGVVIFPKLIDNLNTIIERNEKMYAHINSLKRFELICANIVLICANEDILARSAVQIEAEVSEFAKITLRFEHCNLKKQNEEHRKSHLQIITTMKNDLPKK